MLNPSGEVPVLVGEAGTIAGHYAICEWLEEKGGRFNCCRKAVWRGLKCAA